jgi:hypothetical protein
MSLAEVRELLAGWTAVANSAMLSPNRLHLFHTWDFTPPAILGAKPVRATFDNGRLLIWGEPTDDKTGGASGTA